MYLFVLFLLISTMHATDNLSMHGTQSSSSRRLSAGTPQIMMFVRMPNGASIAINVASNATVADVIAACGLPETVHLSFGGTTLDSSHSLFDAGINPESILNVVGGTFEDNHNFEFTGNSATLVADSGFGVLCLARKVTNGEQCHAIITFDEHAQMRYAIKHVDKDGRGVASGFNAKSLRINVNASGERVELDVLASERQKGGPSVQRHGSLNKSDLGIEICIRIPEHVTITVEWNDGLKEDDAGDGYVGSIAISDTVTYIDAYMQSGK